MGLELEEAVNFEWDTSSVLPDERFDCFTDEICRAFTHLDPELPDRHSPFFARIQHHESDGVAVTNLSSSSYTSRRTKTGISRSDNHDYFLNFLSAGSLDAQQGGARIRVHPGGLFLLDNARPFDLYLQPDRIFNSCVVRLPRSQSLDRYSDKLLNFEWFSRHRLFHLLKLNLAQLTASNRPDEIHCLGQNVVNLVGLILSDREHDAGQSKGPDWFLIEAEVDRNVDDPFFTLTSLAGHFGVTNRTIQNAFAARSGTFSQHLRDKRLRIAMDLLCAKNRSVSIESISATCGFKDPSTFYRSFKRRYGVSPGDVRRNGRGKGDL